MHTASKVPSAARNGTTNGSRWKGSVPFGSGYRSGRSYRRPVDPPSARGSSSPGTCACTFPGGAQFVSRTRNAISRGAVRPERDVARCPERPRLQNMPRHREEVAVRGSPAERVFRARLHPARCGACIRAGTQPPPVTRSLLGAWMRSSRIMEWRSASSIGYEPRGAGISRTPPATPRRVRGSGRIRP